MGDDPVKELQTEAKVLEPQPFIAPVNATTLLSNEAER
jgi:hypothetical protein